MVQICSHQAEPSVIQLGCSLQSKRMQITARNQPFRKTFGQFCQESASAAADFQQWPCWQGYAVQQGVADPSHARCPPMVRSSLVKSRQEITRRFMDLRP
jgi:hypothetical protein